MGSSGQPCTELRQELCEQHRGTEWQRSTVTENSDQPQHGGEHPGPGPDPGQADHTRGVPTWLPSSRAVSCPDSEGKSCRLQAHQVPECPQPHSTVWTMWKDYEKFSHGHDYPRPCFSASNLVQATSHGACYQEGQRCDGHPPFHPTSEVVHQREENGCLRGVSSHGRY